MQSHACHGGPWPPATYLRGHLDQLCLHGLELVEQPGTFIPAFHLDRRAEIAFGDRLGKQRGLVNGTEDRPRDLDGRDAHEIIVHTEYPLLHERTECAGPREQVLQKPIEPRLKIGLPRELYGQDALGGLDLIPHAAETGGEVVLVLLDEITLRRHTRGLPAQGADLFGEHRQLRDDQLVHVGAGQLRVHRELRGIPDLVA